MDRDPQQARCRACGASLSTVFADLGASPLANSYLGPQDLAAVEPHYPLRALVCGDCLLVQLGTDHAPASIFDHYAYFSSYSTTWLEHSRRFVDLAIERFELDGHSSILEIASNDGYLLQYFHQRGIPVLGVEPASNVAEVAITKGIPTLVEFFGGELGRRLGDASPADLIVANNVLAHTPDLNDFVSGIKPALKPRGVVSVEFPHLLRLIDEGHFDTIYHEHFAYFSLLTAGRVLQAHGLTIFDVQELPTHGGSLRVYARHTQDGSRPVLASVRDLLAAERAAGLTDLGVYESFAASIPAAKRQILAFLIEVKRQGLSIAGYGAPAKGNTLLNYCGIGRDFLEYTVDLSPHKQGRYLPGSRIPIRAPEALRETRPDVVLILPWNWREEIVAQHGYIAQWGGRFVARTPEMGFLA